MPGAEITPYDDLLERVRKLEEAIENIVGLSAPAPVGGGSIESFFRAVTQIATTRAREPNDSKHWRQSSEPVNG